MTDEAHDWNPLLPFTVRISEGSPAGPGSSTGIPPALVVDAEATLEDGRTVMVSLIPKYDSDPATKEGYMQCYRHCCNVRRLLNENIDKISLMAYRPG